MPIRAISADSGTSAQSPGVEGGRTLEVMTTSARTIELQPDAYALVVSEAQRRGADPDALLDELMRNDLGHRNCDLNEALDALAEFRAGFPPLDSVALVREGHEGLETHGARASSSTRTCWHSR
ncbi:MAG: hypothetical protein M3320_00380 [Actinomycetota bacterium]|nr:hypothetical protein [Actinomycetota bacterium]